MEPDRRRHPSPSPSPYRYRRLAQAEEGQVRVRIVRLDPGAFEDEIVVRVEEWVISEGGGRRDGDDKEGEPGKDRDRDSGNDDDKWFALSYTWGDGQARERVTVPAHDPAVDAAPGANYIPVTSNLMRALRHVRSEHAARRLWIDALCIDQSLDADAVHERGLQVQSMHRIYAYAAGVIIWLGDEADDSTYALDSLHRLGASIQVDWTTFEILTPDGVPTDAMRVWNDRERSVRERAALAALLERPWFDRVWIRQEAFFAREQSSVVWCGGARARWAEVRKAIHCLNLVPMGDVRQAERLGLALSVCQRKYSNDPNLLRRMRVSKCGDPRDKIYGILGMVSLTSEPGRGVTFPVEYSASYSVAQVYLDFFLRYKDHYRTLRLLEESGLSQETELRPTWIPDWRSNILHRQLDLSLESATSHLVRDESVFLKPQVLRMLGRRAGQVAKVHLLDESMTARLDPDLWRELALLLHSISSLTTAEEAIERFTRALCCVLNPIMIGFNQQEKIRDAIRIYVKYLYGETADPRRKHLESFKAPKEVISEQAPGRLEQSVRYLGAKRTPLLFTADGHIGIGPMLAKPGDEVWAILGSGALMLLRQGSTSQYELVGPCFMHGFNWGEAILGPLPKHYTVVPWYEPTRGSYVPHYLDTNSGSSSMWDPRIAWDELQAHPPMVGFVPVTAPPGEPFRIRPDSEYLQHHGIHVQQIDLI